MRLALLFVYRLVGCSEQANRRDLSAAAAGAMTAGHGVVVIVIQEQALAVTTRLNGALREAGRGIRQAAEKLEIPAHLCLNMAVLLLRAQCSRPADINAFKAAAAFPWIDVG